MAYLHGPAPAAGPRRPPLPRAPAPVVVVRTSPCAARFEVPRLPLLAAHRQPRPADDEPDLVLRANRIASEMDVVLHLHGYALATGVPLRLREREAFTGLDFCDPSRPDLPGRTRPTLGLLPRGRFVGGRSGRAYDFPALVAPGGAEALRSAGLRELARRAGMPEIAPARFILTGHSGGGAPLLRLLTGLAAPPHEIHLFDATYGGAAALVPWLQASIARDARALRDARAVDAASARALLRSRGGALRVLYRPGTGTAPGAEQLAGALEHLLRAAGDVSALLRSSYRVEATRVGHMEIPRSFGFRLLADAGADLPGAQPTGSR
jgi:hypothetical protein